VPSEARPVTRNWLTNKELLARTPPDRHTKPYEPRPVTHARPAGNELPARSTDEQPAREAQTLNTLPSGARPVTRTWHRDHPGKMKALETAAATPGADPPGNGRHANRKWDATPTHPHTPGTREDKKAAGPCDHKAWVTLPSEARPVTGNRHTTDEVVTRVTGRPSQGKAGELGATEANHWTVSTIAPLDIAGVTHIVLPPRRTLVRTRVSFVLANADGHITDMKTRESQDTQTSRGIDAPPHS
jgi:hypothetical protein